MPRQVISSEASTGSLGSIPIETACAPINEIPAITVKAATAGNPRARDPVGRNAGTILRARRLLPDRAFDAVVKRMYLP